MQRVLGITALALALGLGAPVALSAGTDTDSPAVSTPERSASVHGRVLDLEGNARADALVLALRADRILRRPSAAVTDRQGRFEFSELPPGRYVLLAIHGHHSPGRSDPVVVGDLGVPFPLKLVLGDAGLEI